MRPLYLVAGVAVLVVAVVDLVWTTLWVDGGAGPLSARLATWMWRALRRVGHRHSRTLSLAGPLILMATLVAWVGLVWAGWTLLFAAGEPSLVDTRNQDPVDWAERVYFVAYSMFTMGNGDFSPVGNTWQIATALTTGSGMLFVTLGVSYVVSVLGAVSRKRSFATGVTGLGISGESVVERAWDDRAEDFHELDPLLSEYASQLDTLAEQHQSYPILHYYHSVAARDASATAVAVLDESLTILRFGVPEEHRPNDALLRTTRSSVQSYLQTLDSAFIEPAARAPAPPTLDSLREEGVPTVSDAAFASAVDELDERRRKLLGTVRADGWRWGSPER